jgi:C_GCAxxG_C_C family probable redox protein
MKGLLLYELLKNGYGQDRDFNCAEKILYGANEAYQLGLSKEALKMAAGFGGGMAIEDVCGALTASIMVLGRLFVRNNAHENIRIKDLTKELLTTYRNEMGDIDCAPLKTNYRTEEIKCRDVILKAAEILDKIVERELKL